MMPWNFVDKLLTDILDTANGNRDEPIYITPDGRHHVKRPKSKHVVVWIGDRNNMYDVIKKAYRVWGTQSDYLVYGDIRATRSTWERKIQEKRELTESVAGGDHKIMDGFEESILDMRTRRRRWDGDLDILEVD